MKLSEYKEEEIKPPPRKLKADMKIKGLTYDYAVIDEILPYLPCEEDEDEYEMEERKPLEFIEQREMEGWHQFGSPVYINTYWDPNEKQYVTKITNELNRTIRLTDQILEGADNA